MKLLLVIFKSIVFCLLMAGFYALWLIGLLFIFASNTWQYKWRNWVFRNWSKYLLTVLGIKLNALGILPTTPCLLVANHLSYLDIVVLASQFDCIFVAKSEVASWPIIGRLCQSMATIFIDRKRQRDILRVNQLIENALNAGKSVMFFPEGTTTDGAGLLPFKSALFEPAVKTATPIAIASLHYQTRAHEPKAAQSVCWWGDMDFLPHLLGVFGLTEIEARLNFGAELLRSDNRKQLAKDAQAAVQEIFLPASVAPQTRNELMYDPLGEGVCNHCK